MDTLRTARLKTLVEMGGGEWVGVQEGMEGIPAMVLFNSPQINSTLAVEEELLLLLGADVVRDKIKKNKRVVAAARISITREVFDQLVENLKSCLELLAKERK